MKLPGLSSETPLSGVLLMYREMRAGLTQVVRAPKVHWAPEAAGTATVISGLVVWVVAQPASSSAATRDRYRVLPVDIWLPTLHENLRSTRNCLISRPCR